MTLIFIISYVVIWVKKLIKENGTLSAMKNYVRPKKERFPD